ncbi:hypothetical protein DPO11_26245, partial [Salmonella enterica]|nr:hypothetical protein [Salmonella enterica]
QNTFACDFLIPPTPCGVLAAWLGMRTGLCADIYPQLHGCACGVVVLLVACCGCCGAAVALGYERPFDAISTHCKSLIKLDSNE